MGEIWQPVFDGTIFLVNYGTLSVYHDMPPIKIRQNFYELIE